MKLMDSDEKITAYSDKTVLEMQLEPDEPAELVTIAREVDSATGDALHNAVRLRVSCPDEKSGEYVNAEVLMSKGAWDNLVSLVGHLTPRVA